MPQQNAQGINVSEEEERYLRRAFRRFALPYVLIFAAVAWIATTVVSSDDPPTDGSPDVTPALNEIQASLAALKQSLTDLDARVDRVGSEVEKAGRRIGALENRAPGSATSNNTAGLERDLRDATRRLAQLEKQISEAAATERIDALTARMRRIEETARSVPAAPPPVPPAAAPAQ